MQPISRNTMLFYTRNFLPFLHHDISTFISSSRFQSVLFHSASRTRKSSTKLSFIAAYLVTEVGLSLEKAIEASKQIQHIRTPSKPDAVLRFLIQIGLDDAGIINAVSRKPNLLCIQVEGTLKPKVRLLQQAGFSEPEIARLISENPFLLHRKNFHRNIEFLRDLFSSKEALFKALIKNQFLLSANLEEKIIPNVSYLRTCGLSKEQVMQLLKCNHRLITRRLDFIPRAVQRALDLGFSPESKKFFFALQSTFRMSTDSIDAKIEVMKGFGFSEAEISSAIHRVPQLLFLSVENIKSKMHFFINTLECELSYLITHPMLLCYSFEKRLVPRNHVLQVLMSKGLPKRKCGLFYFMMLSEKKFMDKFVLPYLEEIPDLREAYLSACDGKFKWMMI